MTGDWPVGLGQRQRAALDILKENGPTSNMQRPLGQKLGRFPYVAAEETNEIMRSLVRRGLVRRDGINYVLVEDA